MEEILLNSFNFAILSSALGRERSRDGLQELKRLEPDNLLIELFPAGYKIPDGVRLHFESVARSNDLYAKLLFKISRALAYKASGQIVINLIENFEKSVLIEAKPGSSETFSTRVQDDEITVNIASNFLERCSLPAFTHILELEDERFLKINKSDAIAYDIGNLNESMAKGANDFFAGWFQWLRKPKRVSFADVSQGPSIHYMRGQRDAAQRLILLLAKDLGWPVEALNSRKIYFHDKKDKPVKYLDEYIAYILTDLKARQRLETFLTSLIKRLHHSFGKDATLERFKMYGGETILPEPNAVISSLKPTKTIVKKGKKGKTSKEVKILPLVRPSELVVIRPCERNLVQLLYDPLWDKCNAAEQSFSNPDSGWRKTLKYDDFKMGRDSIKKYLDAERDLIMAIRKSTQSRMKLVPLKEKAIDFKALKTYFSQERVDRIEFKTNEINVLQVLDVKCPTAWKILYATEHNPSAMIRADNLLNSHGLPDQVFRLILEGLGPQLAG